MKENDSTHTSTKSQMFALILVVTMSVYVLNYNMFMPTQQSPHFQTYFVF